MRRRISCSERSFESVACCADANFTVVMLKPPVEMSGTTHRTDQGVQICGANKKISNVVVCAQLEATSQLNYSAEATTRGRMQMGHALARASMSEASVQTCR